MFKETRKRRTIMKRAVLVSVVILGLIPLIRLEKRAKESKVGAAELARVGPVTINAGSKVPYVVPTDATTKYEALMDASYLQQSKKSPNFKKVSINAYSTNSGDAVAVETKQTYQLPNGDFLLIVSTRNDGDVILTGKQILYNTSVLKTDKNGVVLDKFSLATGKPYNPLNTVATTDNGEFSINPSSIIDYGNQVYGITYTGFSQTDKSEKKRLVKFSNSASGLTNIKWENTNWIIEPTQYIATPRILGGTLDTIAYGYWQAGDTNKSSMEIYKYNGSSSFSLLTKLKIKPYAEMLPIANPSDYGVWLYDVRKNADNGYFGRLRYASYGGYASNFKQVFGKWNSSGNLIMQIDANIENATVLHGISDENTIYFYNTNNVPNKLTTLYKLNTTNYAVTKIKDFPVGTTFSLTNQPDAVYGSKYVFYGYVANPQNSEFSGLIDSPSSVLAYLDSNFKVVNAAGVESDFPVSFSEINDIDGKNMYVAGATTSRTFSKTPVTTGWPTKVGTQAQLNAIFGSMEKIDDYAPGIKFSGAPIVFNIEDPKLNVTTELLKGVTVTDVFDLDKTLGNKTQAWLNARINQNPLDPKINAPADPARLPIDWKALGFDKAVYGPQTVKYFVTDSSLQTTSAARVINKIDTESVYNEKGALSAKNFSVPIANTASLNALISKSSAGLKAWDLTTGDIKDDGTVAKNIVTVDAVQLKAIQDAKAKYAALAVGADKSTVIKPYDLKFTFQYGAKALVRTIKVFVTDENTVVDKTNNVVLYGFGFTIPLHKAKNITSAQVIANAKATAWDLKTSAQLPTAKITSNVAGTLNNVPATPPGPGSKITTLTYDGKVNIGVKVTLTVSQVKLTVKHQDENGKPLVDTAGKPIANVVTSLNIAGPYNSAAVIVTGYTLTTPPANAKGIVPETDFTLIYKYKGSLSFVAVPAVIEFETGKVFALNQTIQRKLPNWEMTIRDTRGTKTIWTVQASLTSPLKNAAGKTLPNALRYVKADGTEVILGTSVTTMHQNASNTSSTPVVTPVKWTSGKGLVIKTRAGEVERGAYEAEIKWVLVDGL